MSLLDALFPKYCVNCKRFGAYVCTNCFSQLSFDTQVICLLCGKASIDGLTHAFCKKKDSIDGVFCAVTYKQTARKLIQAFKYNQYVSDIQTILIELFYEALIQKELFIQNIVPNASALIPIPLTAQRLRQRGYNQSLLLANGLSKKLLIPVLECLIRKKETKPQVGLHKNERKTNVKDAFVIKKQYEKNSLDTAFLIDDVLTTGSTLAEAAKVLKKAGFQKVWGLTLARD